MAEDLIKLSKTPGRVPKASDLAGFKFAWNARDGKMYGLKDNGNGTFAVVPVGQDVLQVAESDPLFQEWLSTFVATAAKTYLSLTDTPKNRTGKAKHVVGVNDAETADEYIPTKIAQLTDNSDFPATYVGQALKLVRVKADESGVEFFTSNFLTSITKAQVEAVLTGAITSHTHNYQAPLTTSDLYMDTANHRVGVGTVSPAYKLEVIGANAADAIRSYMGFDIYQVPDPVAPTGVVSAGGSVDTGLHYYGIVYGTATGSTHITYSAGITTTTGNNTVTLTIPISPDPRVTNRKIYRTKVGGQPYSEYLLATITDNTTTIYIDTAPDSSLTGSPGTAYFKPNTTSNNITVNGTKAMTIDRNLTTFGVNAGLNQTTGGRNTFLGYFAGINTNTGSDNTYVGNQAGSASQSDGTNTAVGSYALNNITGGGNTGIGYGAQLSSSGSSNITIGVLTGYTASVASNVNYNVLIGNGAGTNIATNSQANVVIGHSAGNAINGSNNIFLGYNAGKLETVSSKLIIDSFTRSNEALGRTSAIIYGVMSLTPSNQILSLGGGGNVGINTIAPTARLHLPAGTATANTSPLKFSAGTLLAALELGALEFTDNGTDGHLYITRNVAGVLTRTQIV